MEILIFILFVLLVLSLMSHAFWLFVTWVFKQATKKESSGSVKSRCQNCGTELTDSFGTCALCGWQKPSTILSELLKDLAATERQLERFNRAGRVDAAAYAKIREQLEVERQRLTGKSPTAPGTGAQSQPHAELEFEPPSVTQPDREDKPFKEVPPSVVAGAFIIGNDNIVIEPVPTFFTEAEATAEGPDDSYARPAAPGSQRRSFSEVLNTFLEENNIRWGEIIGGLLIIGCSTALVVSLWSEIAQIPVLKFFIFTTVTAALFGIGLYTEHRWKLPTTSRGILTTATLLVPLNFLAIAAVSSGVEIQNTLILGSELLAPAVFLCLVYFAGKVLTPDWPHLLVAGVLGSSIGQLLIRHFASPELEPGLLVALGLFPLACYVGSSLWMLKKSLADGEVTEDETIAIFITLGALTFAAVLPFALLLYKGGPVWLTMIYLAPVVSVAGFPLLTTGMLLWRRVTSKELVAARTVGTSLALLGTAIVVSGMVLAWPNPASIVPAALINFVVFTVLAILLRLPAAHLPAAICFALAYLVLFHVSAGHVPWLNLRVVSLLTESLSVSSGQVLATLFIVFVVTSELLTRRRTRAEGDAYLAAALATAVVSLILVTAYGLWSPAGPFAIWLVYGVYSAATFWIAARRNEQLFSWIGSALLLFALAQAFAQVLHIPFPWQTAFLTHATVCAIAVVVSTRFDTEVLARPLYESALLSSFVAVICLAQAGPWETTAMQAQSLFWLSGIWLMFVWFKRQRALFVVFQIALTIAVVVAIKAALQQYEWYAYLPHAWLHPWGLQIQGTVLLLLSLVWVALRLVVKRVSSSSIPADENGARDLRGFIHDFKRLLDLPFAMDRIVLWIVLAGFVLLAGYGALSGLIRELSSRELSNSSWDIAGFPHDQVLQLGSWIVLALLLIAMLANLWERRRSVYLLGTLIAILCALPLLAGTWETQTATASAWRWLAAIALAVVSVPIWFHAHLAAQLKTMGWPSLEISASEAAQRLRLLLFALVITPLLLLTFFPALLAINYVPVHGPSAGVFAPLTDSFSYGAPLVLVALVLIVYAVRERLPHYAFAAGVFVNFTVTMIYLLGVVAAAGSMNRVVLVSVIYLNALTFSLYALAWLSRTKRFSSFLSEPERLRTQYFLRTQVCLAVGANLVGFAGHWFLPGDHNFGFAWLAIGVTTILLFACLWHGWARYAVAGLYLLGLMAAGSALLQSDLPAHRFTWAAVIVMSAFAVLTSLLWNAREQLFAQADRLHIPRQFEAGGETLRWLVVFNSILAIVVTLLAFRIELRFLSFPLRATAAVAVILQAFTFALLAGGLWRERLRRAAVAALVVGLVFFGWSFLVPGVNGTWLNRAVILMVEMFVLTALYGLGLNKGIERETDWVGSVQACVPWIVGIGIAALLFSLATEVFYQVSFGAVRISPLALLAIGLTLAGAIAISLLFALSPTHDPLKLSERGRMNYVYAAELLLALLFLHIRLTLPWLFTGFFERYWPLVVMVIAYLGVAMSETLRRRKLLVLAQPLERTGAFLPLLPVLGFWLANSEVDYSALLFIVGGLYGLLSILRRSFIFGLVAALAGNAGLWYLWHRSADYHFFQHPQLWLVPIAVSVLIAAYLNEEDFTEEQMAGIRYLSLVTIYASSTADIFINGVAESPWLPLVLAAFSLAGIFCGIIFRVRGFLLLGSVFLLLAIITMIWYASANLGWTWLWYVAGIVSGATIIFMFAVFEKKRSEVLRVVEGFKEWDR